MPRSGRGVREARRRDREDGRGRRAGNPSVAIVPFTDAIYAVVRRRARRHRDCIEVGGVDDDYEIAQLEVTVEAVGRLPQHRRPRGPQPAPPLLPRPRAGAVGLGSARSTAPRARPTAQHYSVALPGVDRQALRLRHLPARRTVRQLALQRAAASPKKASEENGTDVTRYRVRLGPQTERGMYDLASNKKTGATRAEDRLRHPEPGRVDQVRLLRPRRRRHALVLEVPDQPGHLRHRRPAERATQADAPNQTTLDPTTGDVTNAADQPVATFHASRRGRAQLVPGGSLRRRLHDRQPVRARLDALRRALPGQRRHRRAGGDPSPWGTLDQGGNVVEWTDTITPSPAGNTKGRVWRRLHGGIANAPAYQLWLSAVGLNPQEQLVLRARSTPGSASGSA